MRDSDRLASIVLRPHGPLDGQTCGALRIQLATAFAAHVGSIVLDLRDVPSIDRDGLGVLAGADRHLRRQDGVLTVVRATPAVASALRINDLSPLLPGPPDSGLRDVAARPNGAVAPAPRRPAEPRTLVAVPDQDHGLALPG